MARSFDFTVEAPVTVEQLHSAFSEEDYWLARLAAFGGGRLDSLTVAADGSAHVAIVQSLRHDGLPGLFAKLYPGDLEVVQNETWSLIRDDLVRGEIRTAARAVLGSGLGTVFLGPTRNASHLKCTARVEAKLPLVGGTVESLMSRQMIQNIPVMLRFTAQWIAEHE